MLDPSGIVTVRHGPVLSAAGAQELEVPEMLSGNPDLQQRPGPGVGLEEVLFLSRPHGALQGWRRASLTSSFTLAR